ncbi:hypothetical protein Nepgr_006153 [Nepenthes gracilis]|uniref:Uncharacterized protein n=1 Tax=Nepenthes gracilis TaxID=150966 RepID=A0AAD3S4W3_NEPGR|nr:hypothetical protein Nepgr_006153 [Nepenthes gracilis]
MGSLQPNLTLESLFAALDPNSVTFSDRSNSRQLSTPQLSRDPDFVERGPRYNLYANLRESKLREKRMKQEQDFQTPKSEFTPPAKKSVKFEGISSVSKRSVSSVLTRSVPDFSSVMRKENRKPPAVGALLQSSTTPPPATSKGPKVFGTPPKLGGSKSVNSGEKRSAGLLMMGRKSYACLEELKGLSVAAANGIAVEKRGGGGKNGRVIGKTPTVLGYRAC